MPLHHNLILIPIAAMADQQGSHRNAGSSSVSALVSTLVPTLLLAVVLVAVFLLLRNKQKELYAPRAHSDALPEEYAFALSE